MHTTRYAPRLTAFVAIVAMLASCSTAAGPADGGPDAADGRTDGPRDARRAGCRSASNCSSCVGLNSSGIVCGWSIAANACLDADTQNVLQSADGSSSGRDWAPAAGLCPGSTVCQMRTDCVSCDTSGQGCGWCADGNRCLPGLGASSQDGSCTGASWMTRAAYCPNANAYCAGHAATCDDCARTPFCGMCSGTRECRPGTQAGPLNGATQEMCATFWAWLPSDCAMYDAGAPDASPADAGPTDASTTDVSVTDANLPDVPLDIVPIDSATSLDASTVE